MIQLQEKVDGTHGRKRKEASTGIYDYDKIKGNIRYYGAKPHEKKFVPLEYKVEMDLDEILESHPKGKEYGHLLKGYRTYPLFEDSEGNILSMPPIINSNYSGKVTEKTKNLFIEVSGYNLEIITTGLKVMVMALADRGGKVETVTIIDSNGTKSISPEFGTKKISFDVDYFNKISGLGLSAKQMVSLIERSGMNGKIKGKKLEVEYPDYRLDIIHPVDVIEDMIIAYGYNKIEPKKVEMTVVGEELPERLFLDKVRDVCVGLGLQEILTFNLTSKEKQGKKILLKNESTVEIANPVSSNWQVMRKKLMPELLEFLSKNQHAEYPQKIFEVGTALSLDPKNELGVRQTYNLCIALTDPRSNFTTIKSVLDAVTNNLGLKYTMKEANLPFLQKGKLGEVKIGNLKGFIGEVNQETLANFGLDKKTVVLELEMVESK